MAATCHTRSSRSSSCTSMPGGLIHGLGAAAAPRSFSLSSSIPRASRNARIAARRLQVHDLTLLSFSFSCTLHTRTTFRNLTLSCLFPRWRLFCSISARVEKSIGCETPQYCLLALPFPRALSPKVAAQCLHCANFVLACRV